MYIYMIYVYILYELQECAGEVGGRIYTLYIYIYICIYIYIYIYIIYIIYIYMYIPPPSLLRRGMEGKGVEQKFFDRQSVA
jgi:hypothetical protein